MCIVIYPEYNISTTSPPMALLPFIFQTLKQNTEVRDDDSKQICIKREMGTQTPDSRSPVSLTASLALFFLLLSFIIQLQTMALSAANKTVRATYAIVSQHTVEYIFIHPSRSLSSKMSFSTSTETLTYLQIFFSPPPKLI